MPPKLSKSESRLIRKNERAIRERKSNARLAQDIQITSKPIRISVVPDISSPLRVEVIVANYKDCALSWGISHADLEGSWSWVEARQWSEQEYSDTIESHFRALANNTWGEIELLVYNGAGGYRKRLNKYQPLDSLRKEAQDRWLEDDIRAQFEDLFRFRLGTNKRIWGIRVHHHFFLIWYERNHMICRVDRD